eukprot:gene30608-36984_t
MKGSYFDYIYDDRIPGKKELLSSFERLERGIALSNNGQHRFAMEEYSKGIALNKFEAELWFHLGIAQFALGQVVEAVQSYRKALHYNPIHIKSLLNMGTIFHELGDLHQAMKAYDRVLQILDKSKQLQEAPFILIDYLRVQANTVLIWYQIGEVSKALSIARSVLTDLSALDAMPASHPDFLVMMDLRDSFFAHILTMQRSVVVWKDTEVLLHRLMNSTWRNLARNKRGPLLPFDTLLYDIPLHQRLAISQVTCRKNSAFVNAVHSIYKEDSDFVVGFVTADIGNHPTGVLLNGLLQSLKLSMANKSVQKIIIIIYNIGPVSNSSSVRSSIIAAVDYFYDLPLMDSIPLKLKKLYGSHNLDVIVDLQVHTQGSQMELIAAHPPQVTTVNYLVYPGTSGCGFMNYLLADKIVTPPEHARQYSERLVIMPPTYQVAYYREYKNYEGIGGAEESKAVISFQEVVERKLRIRRQLGIPEDAVVLCNFNKLDKIDFVSFQVWMEIMQRVPNSVLWILRPSPVMHNDTQGQQGASNMSQFAELELRAALQHFGIEERRLIFANRTDKHAHIYRHLAADLFVDTFTYTAHSTATDALFGGLPLLTMSGDSFPNRVGASLLSGLLHDSQDDSIVDVRNLLLAHNKKEFADRAVELLQNKDVLSRIQCALLLHLYNQYGVFSLDETSEMRDVRYANHFIAMLQAMKEVKAFAYNFHGEVDLDGLKPQDHSSTLACCVQILSNLEFSKEKGTVQHQIVQFLMKGHEKRFTDKITNIQGI